MTEWGRGRGLQKMKWKRGLQDEKAIEVIGMITKITGRREKKKKIKVTYQKEKKKRGIIIEGEEQGRH